MDNSSEKKRENLRENEGTKRLGIISEQIPEGCKIAGCKQECRNNCVIDCTCECPFHKLETLDVSMLMTLTGRDVTDKKSI